MMCRAAAEMLWDLGGGQPPDEGPSFDSAPTGTQFGGGWGSDRGLSSPSHRSEGFGSSWNPTSESATRRLFSARVEEEMRESGKSRQEVLCAFEEEEEELPSLEGLLRVGRAKGLGSMREAKGQGRGPWRKRVKVQVKKEEEESSEDELMRALDEIIGQSRGGRKVETEAEELGAGGGKGEKDRMDVDEVDEYQEECEELRWNLGALMVAAGVDSALFGWDEEVEDFVG